MKINRREIKVKDLILLRVAWLNKTSISVVFFKALETIPASLIISIKGNK